MRVLVTAGPTREYLDPVRFLTNGSSGRMGCAVAAAAAAAGHEVTLLLGPVAVVPPDGCRVVRFVSVDDLAAALAERFAQCDALVMAAAVGDFRPEARRAEKIPRRGGPIEILLIPTEDLLAGLAGSKRTSRTIVAFAVESGTHGAAEAKARAEMSAKGADFVVVNPPTAMGAEVGEACILSPRGAVLGWARRPKADLAQRIVRIIEGRAVGPMSQEGRT